MFRSTESEHIGVGFHQIGAVPHGSSLVPFLSLTLQVEQTIYPLAQTHRHNVECSLINENGHPTGTGISFYRYEFPVGKIELNEGDSIQIHIVHNMKREIMPGISDIGIRLTAD